MTIEKVELTGPKHTFRVFHSFPEDPTLAVYVSVIKALEDQVWVGTPFGGLNHPLNSLEIQSLVQLLLGRPVMIGGELPYEVHDIDEPNPSRSWKAYELKTLP